MIASDAAPTYGDLRDGLPPGWHFDLGETYLIFEKMLEIEDVVLPGHEPRVFGVASYPVCLRPKRNG